MVEGIREFVKRLTPLCKLEIVEVAEERMPEDPSATEKTKTIAAEGERLLKQIPKDTYVIVLDVSGRNLSSEELASKFESLAVSGSGDITFIIGGAFGLSPAVIAAARERLSFSRMTFTHQMIRLLLVEQIYRAFKIMRGEPYHN